MSSDALNLGLLAPHTADLILACGDLPLDWLGSLVKVLDASAAFVPGNHAPDLSSYRLSRSRATAREQHATARAERHPPGRRGVHPRGADQAAACRARQAVRPDSLRRSRTGRPGGSPTRLSGGSRRGGARVQSQVPSRLRVEDVHGPHICPQLGIVALAYSRGRV